MLFKTKNSNINIKPQDTNIVFKYEKAWIGLVSNWILSTGVWRDEGEWIDEETWNDG